MLRWLLRGWDVAELMRAWDVAELWRLEQRARRAEAHALAQLEHAGMLAERCEKLDAEVKELRLRAENAAAEFRRLSADRARLAQELAGRPIE